MAEQKFYTARRRNLRISPQKLRIAANMIRGRDIQTAMDLLNFSVSKSSRIVAKLLNSAFTNAEAADADLDKLIVKKITVDKGFILKRRMPSGRGRMRANFHRYAHIDLHLAEQRSAVVEQAAKAKANKQAPATKAAKPANEATASTQATKPTEPTKATDAAKES